MKLITIAFTICILAASAIGGWVLFGFKPQVGYSLVSILEFIFLITYFGILSRLNLEVAKELWPRVMALSRLLMPSLSFVTQLGEIIYNKIERGIMWDNVSQTYHTAHAILFAMTLVCVILGILSWVEYKVNKNNQQVIQLSDVVVLPLNVSQPILVQPSPSA